MGTAETSFLLLVLLGACLVALLLVLVARREAEAVREQAREYAASVREAVTSQAKDVASRDERVTERERGVEVEKQRLAGTASRLETERAELDALREQAELERRRLVALERQIDQQLAETAGLTVSDAHERLVRRLVDDARQEALDKARRHEEQVRKDSESRARRIIVDAVGRLALPTSTQAAVSVVPLPSPDLKGPVIGKDGRNIRAFEALTGVTMIVDDQSDDVVLSCFDAERREVARVALERLVADGRVNLDRIETAVAEATRETAERVQASGLAAAQDAGVRGLPPELLTVVGQLAYRASAGQNVQEHLVETALIAASVAADVGADVESARRAGFLHDIGKGVTRPEAGTHAAEGARLAAQHGESPVVVNAIAAHHDEVPTESIEAVIVQIADAISAARPGARREDPNAFVRRMEELEKHVSGVPGVSKVIVMASGHEVRVVVEPGAVPDSALSGLADQIARDIADRDLVLGQVTVTVVRELRARATAG
ncbi:metal dependent phosphohydrolase [Flavimobilis soli]|uniref:Ribonuclease Y n=1 Tax=Flavimobilis soli TaxID=442709 RepID=A0A2A9EA28_9MICO|nr:Rnase Y domain-containing protein [Flavimobilis soli]PFG35917.1 metal dependent phosphohydrolase [Flavimobilis soli]